MSAAETMLITGGQGFFGAWIARRLLRDGTRFVLLDLEPDDRILSQVLDPPQLERIQRLFADVADADRVVRAVEETGATHLIHLAGLQVPACRERPAAGARVNVIGALSVFDAARILRDRVRGVVYASSAAVAGPAGDYSGPIADDAVHRPRTLYGVFKQAAEGCARIYWQDHGVPSIGLRPLSVYGVGREIGITSGPTKAIRAAVLDEEYTIPFTGRTGFNFVDDVAGAFVECARRLEKGALALNLPGEKETVEEFIRAIEDEIPSSRGRLRCEGAAIPVAFDFREDGLAGLLGAVRHTPIREGIRRTAERFRELRARGIIRRGAS